MKKTLFACGLLSALILMLAMPFGCYYDNEEDRFPNSGCDTTDMRYSVEIRQIFQDKCDKCHLSSSPSYSGIPFETYNEVKEVVDNGKLLIRINDANAPMPQDEGLMSICNRQKIEAWVNAGAPDN